MVTVAAAAPAAEAPVHRPPAADLVDRVDQRVWLRDVSWAHYEALLATRGESAVPRLTYLEGMLELMSPSRPHEYLKSFLGRLVETYALETGIELSAYGSWTLRSAPKAAGLEPDECYLVGDQDRDVPDLAIEVVWTHGGIDKLEIYHRLGVGEVWFWEDGEIRVHLLRDDGYELAERSALFPELDLALLASFLDRPTMTQAVKAFRDALRG